MNSLLINCSHFSPDPLPRTNTVETGGSRFYAALWKCEAKVVYCPCYGFTIKKCDGSKGFWLHERKWTGFDMGQKDY